jgi:hypothetical protein
VARVTHIEELDESGIQSLEAEAGWLSRLLARWTTDADDREGHVPSGPLLLSLLCLGVPVVGAAAGASLRWSDPASFLWALILIPPFLLSYYRGWWGAALGLVAGMAALATAAALALGDGAPVSHGAYTMPGVVLLLV